MTSESEFELVEITHFINPHLFWINRIEEIDREYLIFYNKLQTYAQQADTCLPQLRKVYAFKDPIKKIWARGIIELDIDLKIAQSLNHVKSQNKTYKVWLIDEGRPIDVSHLPHKLSREFREKETKCERCILFGVIPAITDFNTDKAVFEKRRICDWQVNARLIVKELISTKNAQVYFKTRKYLKSVVIGDLRVVLKNKLYNIAEYLVERGLAFMDENNFNEVQRYIILSPTCCAKSPSEAHSKQAFNQSRLNSAQLKCKKTASNTSSRSVSVQSETIPIQCTKSKTLDNAIADDLDDIIDLVDSDPPLRAFTKRINSELQISHHKPLVSDSLSSENEISKLSSVSDSLSSENEVSKFQNRNNEVILNRTAGRGCRRSMKLKQEERSIVEKLSEISKSQNISPNFINYDCDSQKNFESLENCIESTSGNSLSVRKKLFNSKDKFISNISGKTPAKKLFTNVSSINAIDHTLSMNQDVEFYDNTDSEFTSSEDNATSNTIKKDIKYISNKHKSEVKNCIAVVENVDETPKKLIIEEEILGIANPEDDALFLQRLNQKKAQKLEDEKRLLDQIKKKNQKSFNNETTTVIQQENEKRSFEHLTEENKKPLKDRIEENSPIQTTVKSNISKLFKKLKIHSSPSTITNDPKPNSIPSSIRSLNSDSSSQSRYESGTSSNDFTDNEVLDKTKQTSIENNSTKNWPKVNISSENKKLNIMPAGVSLGHPNNKQTKNQNQGHISKRTKKREMEETDGIITTETFLERQVKTFQHGRNIKTDTSMSHVLNVGGLNNKHFLIHSFKKITPIQNVGQAYLHSDIRSVLASLNIIELHNLQTYVWPAINRGENVVAIWSKYIDNKPDENSCMMFLPILCNTIIENNYDDLEKFDGPIMLILCAHKAAARIIYEKTLLLLSLTMKREKFEHEQKFKNISYNERVHFKSRPYLLLDDIDVIRGDIVITTPKCFLNRLKQMREYASAFRRLCHLVIDDADIITDRYFMELNEILTQCQNTLDRRRSVIRNIQLILTGEKWTNNVEELCKKSQIKPVICIESQIEAAIYAKVNMNLQFIKKEKKIEILYELINKKISTFKTILMCNKYSEIEEVISFLNTKGIEPLSIQKYFTSTEVKDKFNQWNNEVFGAYKLLVFTDDILADISITSAMWLIHYTLPRTWTHFSNRFNTLSGNYSSFYATPNKSVPTPKVHIFIDENHLEVIPRMIHFLERLSKNIDFTKLLPLKEAAIIAREEKKLNTKNTELCYSLLSTGICPNEFRCKKRHLLFSNIDDPIIPNIKIVSSIKLKFVEQYDAVHYSAQLIDSENNYKMLSTYLTNYNKNGGKLVQNISEQLTFDVFVANVKPYHDEIMWDTENKAKINKILSSIDIYNPNIFVTGNVQLMIGNCIWIDNIQIIQYFPNSGTYLERLNLTYELQREHIIEKNPLHLKNLIELCKKANINLKYQDSNVSIKKTNKYVKKTELKVQYAFLEVGAEFEKVFFLSTDVESKFYLGRYDFNKSLNCLLDDILQTALNCLYPKELNIVENNYCLAWMSQEKMYYRAQICEILSEEQVKCFLIDEGYDEIFNKIHLKPIKYWMLSKLPAQSISCRLFGVEYNSSILERFEDMYNPLWAKCIQRDPDGTHAVLLIQKCDETNYIINSTVLEEVDSIRITSEVFQDDDFILPDLDGSNSDEDCIDITNPNIDNVLNSISLDEEELQPSEEVDICIYDPVEFYKGLLRFEGPPINEYKHQMEINKNKNLDKKNIPMEYSNKIIDLQTEEIVSSTLLPTVLWHQTDNTIVLKIQLTDIKNYDLAITQRSLLFRTNYDGKQYELNLSLYEDVDETNYFNEPKGMEIVIKLTKLIKGKKWPRLLESKQRFRNIKLNLDQLSDDETDDKKITPFLQEFSNLEDDDTDEDELRYEIGSDDDDSSDWGDNNAEDL